MTTIRQLGGKVKLNIVANLLITMAILQIDSKNLVDYPAFFGGNRKKEKK